MDEFFTDIEDMEQGDYSAVASIPEDMPESRVFILVNELGMITRIEGEYSLPDDLTDWVLIDSGYGDRFALAQSHYLDKPLKAEDGTHNYYYNELEGTREATEKERETERASFPEPIPSLESRITELEINQADLLLDVCMLELGLDFDDIFTEDGGDIEETTEEGETKNE